MAIPTFKLHVDAALTTPFINPLITTKDADGSSPDSDYVLYLGSVEILKTMQTKVNPGVDPIILSILDTVPAPGDGPEPTDIKLALSNAGLTAAVAGDPLSLGTTISGGVGAAIEIHIRISGPVMPSGTYNEISISDNGTEEV